MTTDTARLAAEPGRSGSVVRAGALADLVPALVLAAAGMALVLSVLSLAFMTLDRYAVPVLVAVGLSLLALLGQARRVHGVLDGRVAAVAVGAVVAAVVLAQLPEYITGLQVNGIVHRSLVSAAALLAVAAPALSLGAYYLLGATPHAEDVSRYPLLLLPVALLLGLYAFLLAHVLARGAAAMDLGFLTTPYRSLGYTEQSWVNGWPVWVQRSVSEVGMRNHIGGTLLLVAMTAMIATPIGIAVGVFSSEYGPPWLVRAIRGCTTLLRAMSPFVLAVLALRLATGYTGTVFADFLAGSYVVGEGTKLTGSGSYLLAAAMIAVLVTPVIARATEEGCRSLPKELREGSWSLGASDAYTLRRIVMPWSLPSVLTGVLLACAEAAGSLAIILFIAGTGDHGVRPLGEVTSLSYLVFAATHGVHKPFREAMAPYQFTAALLLVVLTVGLTVLALLLKRRLAKRHGRA
jgi:ABC-type phosphate transport system permease subunit